MIYKNDNVEGKYRCNHPESDFQDNGKGPIEMKKEHFIEYTHRNETVNLQYDVWEQKQKYNTNEYENASQNRGANSYQTLNDLLYEKKNSRQTSQKNSSDKAVILFLFVLFGLPMLFSIFSAILEVIF